MARDKFDALEQIVKDVAQALDIIDIRDFDKALETILKLRDLAERDNRIRELQKKKALLKAHLTQKESKLTVADLKRGEASHLLAQFQTFVSSLVILSRRLGYSIR